ncbi:amino acid ABC transporter permease [Desulfogranum mediterraneum]|uniref:amino acid ABC transporter permease n=1 Tax=Desulfogranum mediterraneum TaxID=160661 RepID=UPI000400B2A8|nr:amino acid ABC transporter permease [Desulfogranum mediterraneum]
MHQRPLKFSLLDYTLLALLLSAAGYITFRITVQLEYNWNWSVIPQYLFRYDQEQGRWVANYLVDGLITTLRLSLWSSLLAMVLGLFMVLARTSSSLFLQLVSRCYIELMRNLPPLVLIFICYFFLADQILPRLGLETLVAEGPEWLTGMVGWCFGQPSSLVPFCSALLTLAIFESAYVAEIFRSGIESVSRHQWEAAHALGLRRHQALIHVILPQAFRRVLPPLAGQLISLIKDSAIVSVISIQELTYQGTQLMASTYLTIEVWITIAAMYLLLTFPCSMAVGWLERRYRRRRV